MTLAGCLALALIASIVLMGVGLYRAIRAHKSATPAFGGAFAGLAVCIGILMLVNALGRLDQPVLAAADRPAMPMRGQIQRTLDDLQAKTPRLKHLNEKPSTGRFPLVALAHKETQHREQTPMADARLMAAANGIERDRAVDRFENRKADEKRYNDALNEATTLGGGGAAPAAIEGSGNPVPAAAPKAKMMARGGRRLEYAHEHVPNLAADTLLWHPALKLENGSATVRFDIASGQATYRVLLLGHGPNGRFGFFETRLDVAGVEP